MKRNRRNIGRRGSTMVEFAFSLLVFVPLLLGTYAIGFSLIRDLEVTQLCRDVASMYGRDVKMNTTAAKNFVQKLAGGFDVSPTGNAVVILSQVRWLPEAECPPVTLGECVNKDKYVFAERLYIGNQSMPGMVSKFGTPPSGAIQSDGTITSTNQRKNSNVALPPGFEAIIDWTNMTQGQVAYLVEVWAPSPGVNIPGFLNNPTVYAMSVY